MLCPRQSRLDPSEQLLAAISWSFTHSSKTNARRPHNCWFQAESIARPSARLALISPALSGPGQEAVGRWMLGLSAAWAVIVMCRPCPWRDATR
jgi:hypothetical protein